MVEFIGVFCSGMCVGAALACVLMALVVTFY
jgi:hypothetical protein